MLDEKKIDDSVEKIFKNEIFLKYTEIREKFPHGSVSCLYDEDIVKDAMKKTAHLAIQEFLKDLWHDAKEEPKGYNDQILLQYVGGYYSIERVADFVSWEGFVKKSPVVKWLYIDDLFPKQEGGEK